MSITDYLRNDLFKGKTVFVTGGGSGINFGIAKTFATLGADLGICGRTQEKLDRGRGGAARPGCEGRRRGGGRA